PAVVPGKPVGGSADVAGTEPRPNLTAAPVDAGAPPVADDSIGLHVTSVPSGADVLLGDKAIGVTPLDVRVKRSPGFATLVIRRARFEDATATVDLSSDYTRELKLVPITETARGRPPAAGPARPPTPPRPGPGRPPDHPPHETPRPHAPSAPTAGAAHCQDPRHVNPFETSCGGQPCPPCPTKEP
ncbi:MAG TPA: PEGA domain-containing protein, partial [Kofleriaceae bacterium]|nr:PEGA domain-containing protein [Kofleriaceae bacterium]